MTNPGDELSSIDFESMIGGPLIAVVHAQSQAAISTVNFIKEVGFKQPATGTANTTDSQTTGDPATVSFVYQKTVPKADGTTEQKNASLTVPFLTMLPIPYLRISKVNIDFLAKINSIEYKAVDTNFSTTGTLQGRAGCFWASARLKVSSQYQRQTREGSTVTRDYSLSVKVEAVQEEMPGGMAKLLSILEGQITETVSA